MFQRSPGFILSKRLFTFSQYLGNQLGNVGFLPKVSDWSEQALVVEHDGSRLGQPPKSLPVYSQVYVLDLEIWVEVLVNFIFGFVCLEEEGLADFECPRTALDGFLGRHLVKESARHRQLSGLGCSRSSSGPIHRVTKHLGIEWDMPVNFMQRLPNLLAQIPTHRRADDTSSKVILA